VDLPQPEWPIRQTNSPFLIRKLKFLTITAGPFGVGYTFVKFDNSRKSLIGPGPDKNTERRQGSFVAGV